jgi:SAM-dependent methyltransferase
MEGFDPKTSFGDETSRNYDAVSRRGDEEETVAFLAGLAGDRDALELAVGTGRIALPLRQAGVRVDGIELSQDMVDRLREKPGGDQVQVTIGDMSRVSTGRSYGLVYLVFNTIGNLLTQDDQVRCFENAARHLTGEGVFALECRVPTAPTRPLLGGYFLQQRGEINLERPLAWRPSPLSADALERPERGGLLLGYAAVPEPEIDRATVRLARALGGS